MQAQQLELLYQHARMAMLASVVAAVTIFFVFLEISAPHQLIGWCIAFVLIYCIRYVEILRFFRTCRHHLHLRRWHVSFLVTSALAGLLWGLSGFILIPDATAETQKLLYTCMAVLYTCALAAGALTTYAVKLSAYFSFTLPCLLPMGVGFLFNEQDFIRTIGLLVLIFLMFLIMLAIRINHTLTESLYREADNNRLMDELQSERDRAEAMAAEMQALSTQDSLTGIANRRHFDEFLEREWQRAMRFGEPISLILGDLDYFKPYNDAYGHLAGDDCLKQIAQILHQHSRRAGDLAARYGGEEFAVVMANTDSKAAARAGESMRRSIESLNIPRKTSNTAENITMSFGISTIIPRQFDDIQSFIDSADRMLYCAKRNGRNQVCDAATVDCAAACNGGLRVSHWDTEKDGRLDAEHARRKFSAEGYLCQIQSYSTGVPIGGHAHLRDEINLVLNGEIEITFADRTYHLKAGDCIHLPAALIHEARVVGSQSLRLLIAISRHPPETPQA